MQERALVRLAVALMMALLIAAPSIAEDEEAAAPEEPPGWTGKVAVGGSISRGTVDALNGVLEALAEREFDPHMVRFGLLAAYGETNASGSNQKQTDRQYVTEYYRHTIDGFYVFVDSLQGRDSVQNIDFRFLANAGPGYRVWDGGEKRFLDVELGVGYRNEQRRGDDDRSDVTGSAGGSFSTLIGPAEFTQNATFLMPFNQTSAWIANARTGLSFPLTDAWAFENSLILLYDNRPVVDTESFNLNYVVSLVYSF